MTLKVGIIGWSGLDNPDLLKNAQDIEITTPFGKPSSPLKAGTIDGIEIVLLARHGRGHSIPPTRVNNKANICALKEQGCTHILATTAVGSLREEIKRGDMVVIDQFIDFTRRRELTFFDEFKNGEIKHTPMAEPFNSALRKKLIAACQKTNTPHHEKGTVVTIEGPRFSTKAESHMFRAWGADIINMSIAPECILANELQIPYAAIAISTDYDCWKEDEEAVTWQAILQAFKENVEKVKEILIQTITTISSIQEEEEEEIQSINLKEHIRTVPHWPKEGVMFRDITTLLENPNAFSYCINKIAAYCREKQATKIAGIESRGFILGAAVAKELHLPLVLIRKKGKLPFETIEEEYQLEYGSSVVEIHKDTITSQDNVIIIDDLLATGGTMQAAINLVERLGGNIKGCAIVIDLPDLKGREKLSTYDLFSLVEYEGE